MVETTQADKNILNSIITRDSSICTSWTFRARR